MSLARLKTLASTVIILQALDLASTAIGLMRGGLERNPLVAQLGWTPLVLLKFACVLALASLPFLIALMPVEKQEKQTRTATRLLAGLGVFYGIVVASNLAVAA